MDEFINELKLRENVLGIILFGSWARGNNRLDSDIDLVVILNEGFERTVEYRNNQAFEITYTTKDSATEYWKENKDDCFGLWSAAKVLYDKDGTIKQLQNEAEAIIKTGKKAFDEVQKSHYKFDSEDTLNAVEKISKTDPATANMILNKLIFTLSERYFDLKQLWTPAPKQRLEKIKEINLGLCKLFESFYTIETNENKLAVAKKIVEAVYI